MSGGAGLMGAASVVPQVSLPYGAGHSGMMNSAAPRNTNAWNFVPGGNRFYVKGSGVYPNDSNDVGAYYARGGPVKKQSHLPPHDPTANMARNLTEHYDQHGPEAAGQLLHDTWRGVSRRGGKLEHWLQSLVEISMKLHEMKRGDIIDALRD
jgi:hypothetical protein